MAVDADMVDVVEENACGMAGRDCSGIDMAEDYGKKLDLVFEDVLSSLGSSSSEHDAFVDEINEKTIRENRENNFRSSGVPKKYLDVELEELRMSSLKLSMTTLDGKDVDFSLFDSFIADVVSGKPRALWLCGNSGTGKTTVALAVLRELCRKGISCAYFKMHRIMQDFEETKYFSSRGRKAGDVMKDLCLPRFRVVDEIGRYPVAEWEKFRMFDISNEVYESGGSSIYISNLYRKELSKFLGSACTDRFRGSAMTLEFGGKTLRGSPGELYTEFGIPA